MKCACGSEKTYIECCEPFIKGEKKATTAEELLRSRYTAYTKAEIDYLKKTLAPESQEEFDFAATKKWATKSQWKGLKILNVKAGQPGDKEAEIEFVVTYAQDGTTLEHHEYSNFRKSDKGQWYFVDGDSHTHEEGGHHHHHHPKQETYVRQGPKIGRNDPCTCGSGKKYKKCCGSALSAE